MGAVGSDEVVDDGAGGRGMEWARRVVDGIVNDGRWGAILVWERRTSGLEEIARVCLATLLGLASARKTVDALLDAIVI